MKVILETPRLLLREYLPSDFFEIKKILADKETMKYYPNIYSDSGIKRWMDWTFTNYKKYGFGLFAIILKENNTFIGDIGITLQNIDNELLPEIGYHINKNFWRKGYMKEAGLSLLNWGFTHLDFDAFYSYCSSNNIPSICAAKSIGMKVIKIYKDENQILHTVSKINKHDFFIQNK